MSLHHTSTFLRSALARDPFCHGDIISPEDVIRIEAKFPGLFDKPVNEERNEVKVTSTESAPLQRDSPGKVLSRRSSLSQISTSSYATTPRAKPSHSRQSNISATTVKTRPKVPTRLTRKNPGYPGASQFHQKCLTNKEEAKPEVEDTSRKLSKPVEKVGSLYERRLTRPAQSLSLEDLRETLKQLLEEDRASKAAAQKKPMQSPYTEDLVKKFFGKKMEELRRERSKAASPGKSKGGEGDQKINKQGNELEEKKATLAKRQKKEATSKASHPMPGFIRGMDGLPPAPPPTLGQTYESKRTDSNLKLTKSSLRKGVGDGKQKHVSWESLDTTPVEAEEAEADENNHTSNQPPVTEKGSNITNAYEDQKSVHESLKAHFRKPKSPMPAIHLRGPQKEPESQIKNTYPSSSRLLQERHNLPKSSYQHLLAAQQATSKLEIKAFLRRQEHPNNFYMKQMQRQQQQQKDFVQSNIEHAGDISLGHHRQLLLSKKTSQTMEKIASELVYTEILHQLNTLKQERERTQEETGTQFDQGDVSTKLEAVEKALPNFVSEKHGLVQKDGESKQKSVENRSESLSKSISTILSEINLIKDKKEKAEVKEDLPISLKSPRVPSQKQSPPRQDEEHLDTECSSMSEAFLNDEPIKSKDEKLEFKKPTSLRASPRMSPEVIHGSGDRNNDVPDPEKDDSTLSGISTFKDHSIQHSNPVEKLESASESAGKDQEHDEDNLVKSKYSDDFLSDKPEPDSKSSHQLVLSYGKSETHDYSDDFTPEPEVDNKSEKSSGDKLPANNGESHIPINPSNSSEKLADSMAEADSVKSQKSVIDKEEPVVEEEHSSNSQSIHLQSFASENGDVDLLEVSNISRDTVHDLVSEGEFIGTTYKSPGEVSVRHVPSLPSSISESSKTAKRRLFTIPVPILDMKAPVNNADSSLEESLSETEDKANESKSEALEESEISFISEGAQIIARRHHTDDGHSIGEL